MSESNGRSKGGPPQPAKTKKARVKKPTEAGRKSAETQRNRVLKKQMFLDALSELGVIQYASQKAGIDRTTYLAWKKADASFAGACKIAERDSTERLETEAFRRAAIGTNKPVFQGGREVGSVREYSDTLLIFLLKARDRAKYQDNYKVEHDVSGVVEHEHKGATELRELLAEIPDDVRNAVPITGTNGRG